MSGAEGAGRRGGAEGAGRRSGAEGAGRRSGAEGAGRRRGAAARAGALLLLGGLASALGCPGPPEVPVPPARRAGGPAVAPGCKGSGCSQADALIAAARAFSDVRHDYLLDTSSAMVPGRGMSRSAAGVFSPVGVACARRKAEVAAPATRAAAGAPAGTGAPAAAGAPAPAPAAAEVTGAPAPGQGERAIDFRYVGIAVDSVLAGADVDLPAYFSAGGTVDKRRLRLVAMALVADEDPQFFEPTEDVVPAPGGGCACGRATHFIGAVKRGAMVAYETDVTAGEAHGTAMGLFKARIAAGDRRVTMTSVGELSIQGVEGAPVAGAPDGGPAFGALRMEVKKAVPLAYAIYPVADVCRFSLAEPEITPLPLDFGVVPYGATATAQAILRNRAQVDVRVTHGERTVEVPAHGSAELTFSWTPEGNTAACEQQTRRETFVVQPKDPAAPVVPRERAVPVPQQVTTGMPTFSRHEPIATETGRSPDYSRASVDWTCPAGYVVDQCEPQLASCLSSTGSCNAEGYRLTAEATPDGRGCAFRCTGPSSSLWGDHGCTYTAAMVCRLGCK
ncbi:hypothetical protein [Sorangium sp. So ce131]|uniref:hypothetical protein n=1 Tax=Sorangium sp. So ce131 TaxID=3133282 RepID=UPI003F5DC911